MFADVSPFPLPSGAAGGNKPKFRKSIKNADFEENASHMFAHQIVRDRVAVVIIGGAHAVSLERGATIFEDACRNAGKPSCVCLR